MNKNNINLLLQHQQRYLIHIDKFDNLEKQLDLDKFSYFIITINKTNKYIFVEQFCYNNDGYIYSILFKGQTAKYLSFIISHRNHLNIRVSIAHALYLGRELMKSELALVLNQQYIQD
uniref:ORF121 n=1 Tax=Pyropia endiviifolia TaxID=1699272 RepID=A0A1U6ZGI8_9RHOD|nr:ORF121 [Pyropia endiviifolia]